MMLLFIIINVVVVVILLFRSWNIVFLPDVAALDNAVYNFGTKSR